MYEVLIMVIASFHLLCYILSFVNMLYTLIMRATVQIENIFNITFCNKHAVFKYVANLKYSNHKKLLQFANGQMFNKFICRKPYCD